MKLKYIKGTTRGNYNPQYILELIKDNELDKEDATRILEEATHIIISLHKDTTALTKQITGLVKIVEYFLEKINIYFN